MAAGDLLQKRSGSFGLAYESTPGTPESAPVYYLTCDSANIGVMPRTYERVNNIGSEIIGVQQSKYNASFDFSNAECSTEIMGYLLWLALGAEDNTTPGNHVITPQFEQQFMTAFKDVGGTFASSAQVQRLTMGKLQSLTINQEMDAYAKISGSGIGTEASVLASGFTPSLDLSGGAAPLSWASLSDVSIGWNGGATASADYIKKFSISIERELQPAAYKISTKLPSHISQGKRTVKISVTFDLLDSDANAAGAWAAILGAQNMEIAFSYSISSIVCGMTINQARITNSPSGEIGAGPEPQEWTLEATAFQDSTGLPISCTVLDGNTDDYDAR